MIHAHSWEAPFHKQIYLDEAVSPLEVDASQEEDSSYHALEVVVAYMEVGCDHSQDLHQHLGHGLEVDPRPGVVVACVDPFGELAFASIFNKQSK